MHQCLRIAEIQEFIASYLPNQGLYALARTCKAFTEVALDHLWDSEDAGLWELLLTFPEDLHEVSVDKAGYKIVRFTRHLKPSDWERYHYYARRIKAMHTGAERKTEYHFSVFNALSSYRPAQSLLPCLESLWIDCVEDSLDITACIPSLINPRLQSFTFFAYERHPSLPPVISQVPRLCPALKEFIFDFSSSNENTDELSIKEEDILEECMTTVHNVAFEFDDLEEIVLRPLDFGATYRIFQHLSNFPSLDTLRFQFSGLPSAFSVPENPQIGFHNLREIYFDHASWLLASTFVDMAMDSCLNTLHLNIDGSHVETYSRSFFLKFFDKLSKLRHLVEVQIEESHQTTFPFQGVIERFNPPDRPRKMKKFLYDCASARLITDVWLSNISTIWTNLSTLDIRSDTGSPSLSLRGLVPLINNCRQLKRLLVSARCEPFDTESVTNRRCSAKWIQFFNSPLSDNTGTLHCLLVMFPKASNISGSSHNNSDDWEDLNRRLKQAYTIVIS